MIATILENPKHSRSHPRKGKKRRILGTVGKVRRGKPRRRSWLGVGAWKGQSRRHSLSAKKGWRRKKSGVSGVGVVASPNPKRRSSRAKRRLYLANPKKMRRVYSSRHRRVGLGSPIFPSVGLLETTGFAMLGTVIASKGGNWLSKTLGCTPLGGGLITGEMGDYLTAFGATIAGAYVAERFTTKERADAVQLGGLLFIGFKAFGNLIGISVIESAPCGSFPGLGSYQRIGNLVESTPSVSPGIGLGAYERLTPAGAGVGSETYPFSPVRF